MTAFNIWSYFQNDGTASFAQNIPRYRYLCKALQDSSPSGCRVLNIGVGPGYLEQMLLEKGYRVSALDPDPSTIASVQLRGIETQVGFAEKVPYPSEQFDVVVASEVLEHLEPENVPRALREICRVLRPRGLFMGTVPYKEDLAANLTVCPRCGERFHRWGHKQSFDEPRLQALLSGMFVTRRMSRRAFVPWSGNPLRLAKSSARWTLGLLGEQIASPHIFFLAAKTGTS